MRYFEPTVELPNDGTLRDAIIQMVFTREDLMGARWETPGWAEINAGLDAAGIHHSLKHANVNIGDDVRELPSEQLHDLVLSHIYTEEDMSNLGPHTPGFTQISEGLAQRGIVKGSTYPAVPTHGEEPDPSDRLYHLKMAVHKQQGLSYD